jgi:ferredoxin
MLRVTVDQGLCQAHGACSQVAPKHFSQDDHGYVVIVESEIDDADRDSVEEAILACPAGALLMGEQ